jgi:hypothetical protein
MDLIDAPLWYWLSAFLVSAWHAFRGCRYYHLSVARARPFKAWRARDRAIVLYVQAIWLYFISSAAGFAALIVAYRMVTRADVSGLTAGEAGLIALAFLFGFVGVSGELPQLAQQGKIPGTK